MGKRKVLITGGAGFIGSNLVAHQLEKGFEVWTVDSLTTGSKENIQEFIGNPSFRFDEADIVSWEKLPEAVAWADRVFHLAASVGQKFVLKKPVFTITNNITSCQRLLEIMAQKHSKAPVLIASTSELYCHSQENPDGSVSETALITLGFRNFQQETYPVAKLTNEIMGLCYSFEYGLKCTIARIFNTVGVKQTPAYGMVVPTFVEQALKGIPLTVYGDGLQTRSFIDVRDTVEALDLLLDTPQSAQQIVNIGNNREMSIIDLAQLVIKKAKSSSPIEYIPYEQAYKLPFIDVRRRQPDLKKLQALIGFKPQWTIEQTIDAILEERRKKQ